MKIVFMGTPEFAVASLKALLDAHYEVVGVVTVADKPAGRGQSLQESAVKKFALQQGLKILQPTNLKDPAFIQELKNLKADLQFVVAFRMLPEVVWNMPPLGTFNLHASLLPRYRGAAPINHAIINGDKESGVTTFKLQHQIDTGNILFQERVPITNNMNAGDLHDTLMELGAKLIVKTAGSLKEHLETGKSIQFIEQDQSQASHAPKIFREHCKINWNESTTTIYNLIRGLSPYPAAYTTLHSDRLGAKVLKIYGAEVVHEIPTEPAGTLVTKPSAVMIATNDGYLNLVDLQLEGKKRMGVVEFLNGMRDIAHYKVV
jgi:methionyl-tRNA formyltransferase